VSDLVGDHAAAPVGGLPRGACHGAVEHERRADLVRSRAGAVEHERRADLVRSQAICSARVDANYVCVNQDGTKVRDTTELETSDEAKKRHS
jgi:hypothetical protein